MCAHICESTIMMCSHTTRTHMNVVKHCNCNCNSALEKVLFLKLYNILILVSKVFSLSDKLGLCIIIVTAMHGFHTFLYIQS